MKNNTVTIVFSNGKSVKIDLAENAEEHNPNIGAPYNGALQKTKKPFFTAVT